MPRPPRAASITMRAAAALALALAALAPLGCAARSITSAPADRAAPRAEAPMTDDERALALASFDEIWFTIRDRHFDPDYNGVDWYAVRAEHRPLVENASTARAARAHMNSALGALGQSHFGIIPASSYRRMSRDASPDGGQAADADPADDKTDQPGEEEPPAPEDAPEGTIGIAARVVGGSPVVFRVIPGSAAADAGVQPGWTIVRIGSRAMKDALRAVEEAFSGQVKQHGMASMVVNNLLEAPVGRAVSVEFLDERARPRTIRLTARRHPGNLVKFGHLPEVVLNLEKRTLDSGVGYLSHSIFFDPGTVMPWYTGAIREFNQAGAPGLIIDLRGNPGGLGAMAMAMGNFLVSSSGNQLGEMKTRDTSLRFVLNPQPGGFKGPVAILVDELSMSTSEIMAGGLQGIGRARIFGTRTPGMALPSVIVRLPNGDGFQFAHANYISADGNTLEGRGVIPDEPVEPDPRALLQGRDPALEAAERWILSQARRAG